MGSEYNQIHTDKMDLNQDLVYVKTRPQEGSVKTVLVDGTFSEKHVYKNKKWVHVCRYKECTEEVHDLDLCLTHYTTLVENYIEGEVVTKGDKQYVLHNKQWKPLCSAMFCENIEHSAGYCKVHNKNKPSMYSGKRDLYSLYNVLRKEVEIQKKKKNAAE